MPAIKMRTQTRKATARVTTRKPRKATGSIARLDAAMKRPRTSVKYKPNPMQPHRALYTKLPSMESALGVVLKQFGQTMREQPGKLGPHSLTMHEDRCPFGVVIWPRASNGADLEEMRDAVNERDHECRCNPLVMYLGAQA